MKSLHEDLAEDVGPVMGVNDLLQVQILHDPDPGSYRSRIEDISEGKLIIAWPTNGGIRMAAHSDQILTFSFVRNGTAFSFNGLVDHTSLKPLPQITVIQSSAVVRVQRRQNFRIKCLIPLEIIGTFKNDFREEVPVTHIIKTTTYDLSASGISFRNAKRIPEGTLLDIKLALPDDAPVIKAPCRVVYCKNLAESSMPYRIGIHYICLTESERARIVRFVYRTQLKGLCT